MPTVSGNDWPSRFRSRLAKWRYALRERLSGVVMVRDGAQADGETYAFRCRSPLEELRARSLFVKEQGTIEWIRTCVGPGESFLDVGANVGLYSLVAARRVGATGHVYAFEPHPANVCSLLENVRANGLTDRISVFSCALNDQEGFFDFNFRSMEHGCAMNQLGTTIDASGRDFRPAAVERKYACSIDLLVGRGTIPPPHHVKIDVDGNEPLVLDGMADLLAGPTPPRTLQVEVNHGYGPDLEERLRDLGYELRDRHFTFHGKQKLARGVDAATIPHNVVYQLRRAA